MEFPDGRRFAFTIIDDTDVATVENIEPVYGLLEQLGMRTTKTVWPVSCPEGSHDFANSQTLEDPNYLGFVRDLQARGFEITWHGATMESSYRERTMIALERFRAVFGSYPRVHANHAMNRENIYWGHQRVDQPLLRLLLANVGSRGYFLGEVQGSPYWWGDLCSQHFQYARNLTFNDLNLAEINPSMPYHDPSRPFVRWWFSASDADDVRAFIDLLHPIQQDRLEGNGGFSIVATHLGKNFVQQRRVHPIVRERLEMLARRQGWFPTVTELLEWLRKRRTSELLPKSEWRLMQWRWSRDMVVRKWKQRIRSGSWTDG